MTREDITAKVHEIIAAKTGHNGTITDETSLSDDIDMDSLDVIELGMCIEKEFQFDRTIPDEDFETFDTVGHLVDYIEKEVGHG